MGSGCVCARLRWALAESCVQVGARTRACALGCVCGGVCAREGVNLCAGAYVGGGRGPARLMCIRLRVWRPGCVRVQ